MLQTSARYAAHLNINSKRFGKTKSMQKERLSRKGIAMRIQIIFYSMYGHIYRMAEAVGAGAREVKGCEVEIYQVPELVPEEALVKSGAKKARAAFAHVPVAEVDKLVEADAIIFGTPTRYGNMCHRCAISWTERANCGWRDRLSEKSAAFLPRLPRSTADRKRR